MVLTAPDSKSDSKQERPSSWLPHHALLKDLEERCRLHPEITGITIEIVTGPGAGLRDLKVLVKEDHKQLAQRQPK